MTPPILSELAGWIDQLANVTSVSSVELIELVMRVSQGFGRQGNIGKISKRRWEHEPIFRERGKKLYKLEDENMVSKFIKRGTNKENVWEHGNIGQFWRGTRIPVGDPRLC